VAGVIGREKRLEMTDHKHLKARVRARMAKTGERYAAARAHVVGDLRGDGAAGSPPTSGLGPEVLHLTGTDPETTGLRILLAHADPAAAAPSEPLANVIAGGIGIGVFAFHYEREGFSSFFLAGRHRWDDARVYLAGAAERLGWKLGTAEASAPATADRRLREALERGPVIAWVDAASLGTRGLPAELAGGGYHTLVVHRIDDDAGSATVSDLTESAFELPLDVLSAARARIAKQKHRVAWLERPGDGSGPEVDHAGAVEAGLAATVRGLRSPRTRNFSLDALADWSDRLRGRGATSWARVFPTGEWRWSGLASIHEYVEHYGSGGGLGRRRFAAGLREAATVTGDPSLLAIADRYDRLAGDWSDIARAALPEDVPLLRRTREAQDRRAAAYATGTSAAGGGPDKDVADAWRELDSLRTKARRSFPMTDDDAAAHLAALGDRVAAIHSGEVEALEALAKVVGSEAAAKA
jgi:hypothetical protein